MKRLWWLILPATLTLLALSLSALAQQEGNQLILVTDRATGIQTLTSEEIRRLFLGLPITKKGKQLEAVINQSDPLLYQIFLQKIVFMSSQVYERHLLENVIQTGEQRPKVHNLQDTLIADLHQSPGKISFIWSSELHFYPTLIVVGETWHPSEEE